MTLKFTLKVLSNQLKMVLLWLQTKMEMKAEFHVMMSLFQSDIIQIQSPNLENMFTSLEMQTKLAISERLFGVHGKSPKKSNFRLSINIAMRRLLWAFKFGHLGRQTPKLSRSRALPCLFLASLMFQLDFLMTTKNKSNKNACPMQSAKATPEVRVRGLRSNNERSECWRDKQKKPTDFSCAFCCVCMTKSRF